MQNGELKAFKHAQKILEYALTVAESKVANSARMLAKGSPDLQWYKQVDALRKYMMDKGLVMDDAFWKLPLKAPAPMKNIRPAMAGTGLGASAPAGIGVSPKGSSFGTVLQVVGIVALGGVAFWLIKKSFGDEKPKKRRSGPYKRASGIVGSRRGWSY